LVSRPPVQITQTLTNRQNLKLKLKPQIPALLKV
jgi:hypothetical protein